MNLSNSDREFFENLNNDLAKSIESALAKAGPKDSGGGGGGAGGVGLGSKIVAGIKGGLSKGIGKTFDIAAGQLQKATSDAITFGNTLARSTAATNRTQLLATKTINEQGKIVTGLPDVNSTFRKFGISYTQTAKILDDAIRANIKNSGQTAQKFLATSQGLGNSLATTNTFLATQTNVLGRSSQASIEFGNDIIGLASSNGILADSIIEAVNAFTKTTRQQTALFGSETANMIQRFVAGAEAAAPGAGTANLIRALTSPEALLNMPAVAGRLGIEAPTDVRDAGQMEKFLTEAVGAIATMGQTEILGQDAITGQQLSQQLQQMLGDMFSLESFQTADLLAGSGTPLAEMFNFQKMTAEELDTAQKNVTGASLEAATVLKDFNMAMAATPSYIDAIGATAEAFREGMPTAEEIREKFGGFLDKFADIDIPLQTVGSSAMEAVRGLKAFTAALFAGMLTNVLNPLGGMIRGMGSGLKGLFGKGGGFIGPKKPGVFSRMGSSIGRGFTSAKNFIGGGISNFTSGAGRILGGAKDFAGKQLGRAGSFAMRNLKGVPVLSAGLPIIEEMMMEDGSLGRGLFRAAGAFGGSIGGGALGTAVAPGVGTGVGAVAGGIGGDKAMGAFYDYLFGGDSTSPSPAPAPAPPEAPAALSSGVVPGVVQDDTLERIAAIAEDSFLLQQAELEMSEGIYMNGQGSFTGGAADMEFETGLTNR